jgi:RNA polymerase nonessential primary-like sigma factor
MRGLFVVLAAAALLSVAAPAPSHARVSGHSERLAARARRGDYAARAALVEEHMGLVRSIAARYRNLGLPTEDLVQEGAIGLLTAIDDYDPARGASFSTYAFWRVRGAVTHALTAHGQLLRPPRGVLERRRHVVRASEQLAAAGREPSVTLLAETMALAPADVADALSTTRVVSLDQPAFEGATLLELVPAETAVEPETQLVSREEARAIRKAVRRLRGRKRTIVSRHFGLVGKPQTLTKIAGDLHLSPERTRTLKNEALRELKVELETSLGA